MKRLISWLCLGTGILLMLTSCKKDQPPAANYPPPGNNYTPVHTVGNKDYYWNRVWGNINNRQEILITSPKITDSTILHGIKVNLAPYSDWDPFELLPLTIQGVLVSYILKPDTLKVISDGPSLFNHSSDIMMEFQ